MKIIRVRRIVIMILFFVFAFLGISYLPFASANHSWGNYHWARIANPFTLKLGDNLSSSWKEYLSVTSTNWSLSDVLDTTIVTGNTSARRCKPTLGRVEVCNSKYGNNGWLGLAQIWVSGDHITQGVTKVNDTYFNTAKYNKPAWKNLVMCQEVGHTFGLSHQDENFSNLNLGTCMDYTDDPDGSIKVQPDNQYPNDHDYEELGIIYSHLDSINTLSQTTAQSARQLGVENLDNRSEWGQEIRTDSRGHSSLFVRDLGNGNKLFTFVISAN